MINWWKYRLDSAGIQPNPLFLSVQRQGDVREGHLAGFIGILAIFGACCSLLLTPVVAR